MHRLLLLGLLIWAFVLSGCGEPSKEELFQQGMEFVNAGNYQAGVSLFKDALNKDPNYIDARVQLGIAYQETKKLDKAENELEKVQHQDPSNYEASLRLAQIYLKSERVPKAIKLLFDLEQKHPNDHEIQRSLGEAYAREKDYNLSEARFRKALEIQPSNLTSQLGLVGLLFVKGQPDEALLLLKDSIAEHPDSPLPYYLQFRYALQQGDRQTAIHSLERVKTVTPEDIAAQYMLALLYFDAGELDKGRLIGENLKADNPQHPMWYRINGLYLYLKGDYENAVTALQTSLRGMPDVPGFYFTGLTLYRLNQLEQALSSFQKALDKNPDNPQMRLMVAQTLLKQGRLDDSINEAERVLALNPLSGQAHNILGSAFMAKGQYDRAMEELNTAIEIEPSLSGAYLKKGLFNLKAGNSEEGVADLESALAASPEILNTRLLLAAYYLQQHNYPEAIKILNEGLNGSPDNALIYNYLAAAYFGQNKQEEAVSNLEKAKKIKPDYLAPYLNLANFYTSRGDRKAALNELLSALKTAPENLQIHLKLAALYELNGDKDNAAKHYQAASETNQSDGYIALAAFWARSAQSDKSLEVLKAGYAKHPDSPTLMVRLAEELLKHDQYGEAVQIYIHLEETSPGNGLPLLIKAQLDKGDFAAANEAVSRVITERPESEYGYLLLSAIHSYREEWSLAETALKRGLKFNEDNINLNMSLARIYLTQGKNEEAQSIYNKILVKQADFIPAIFGKAIVNDNKGNKRQAQDLYNEILERNENYLPALNNLANLYLDVYADYKKALELAIKAFRINPGDPSIIDTVGYALLKNGKTEEAITFLEKAASLKPKETAIQLHLAQAYMAAGRNDEAVARLSSINESNAQQDQIKQAQSLLKGLR